MIRLSKEMYELKHKQKYSDKVSEKKKSDLIYGLGKTSTILCCSLHSLVNLKELKKIKPNERLLVL